MLSAIVVVLLLGAFFGFIFSKKGKESEGAVGGAKKSRMSSGRFCLPRCDRSHIDSTNVVKSL